MNSKICLVGQILIDVLQGSRSFTQLGGIVHSARALVAMHVAYSLAYFAPEYLDGEIKRFATDWGAASVEKLGNVLGAPNLIIVPDPKEVGSKHYELILRKNQNISFNQNAIVKPFLPIPILATS